MYLNTNYIIVSLINIIPLYIPNPLYKPLIPYSNPMTLKACHKP